MFMYRIKAKYLDFLNSWIYKKILGYMADMI